MLIWFMHGASVRNPAYADLLRSRLSMALALSEPSLLAPSDFPLPELQMPPAMHSAYWGDVFEGTPDLWDSVVQDLAAFKWDNALSSVDEVFHYQQRREQLVSAFFSDIFSYLNSEIGRGIRKAIALQFLEFLSQHPTERDLHIVAHSLGSVVLLDMLFSGRYLEGDPAHYLRSSIKGLAGPGGRKVTLRSITTLGSPILFFQRMLDIPPYAIADFMNRYQGQWLRWVNVVHASDIFAYPIRSGLGLAEANLYIRDQYLGERNFLKTSISSDLSLALGIAADHTSYWKSRRVSELVAANLLGQIDLLDRNIRPLEMGEAD
jgi:hypothetical protein